MSALRIVAVDGEQSADDDQRVATRSRVFMRAAIRVRGSALEYPVTIKDISSTGMSARSDVSLFAGTRIEIDLPNIGWIPGEVVRIGEKGLIGVRFAAVIQPELTLTRVQSTSRPLPSQGLEQLRRV